ncbi:MAG: hypothetical protein AAFN11_21805 [Chloroflexota bacterium]
MGRELMPFPVGFAHYAPRKLIPRLRVVADCERVPYLRGALTDSYALVCSLFAEPAWRQYRQA